MIMIICVMSWLTLRPVPDRVEGLAGVVSIACGRDHSLAVCAAGEVLSWGAAEDGQLGTFPPLCSSDRPRQDSTLIHTQILKSVFFLKKKLKNISLIVG